MFCCPEKVGGAVVSGVKKVGIAVAVGVGAALSAGSAMAASVIDVSNMAPDITMVGTLGGAICTGLLGIWGVRKVIKLVNRS